MSTQYYGLPTVDPDSTLSFPDAVNGLANATDAVLHGIQTGFEGDPYDLPVASSDILGGVRVGDGFEVFSDGLLTTTVKRFELEPATKDKIGGVLIGKNMTVDAKGRLGVGSGAFADTNVKTENLVGGAVTSEKIADGGVVEANLDPDVQNAITGVDRIWSKAFRASLNDGDIFRDQLSVLKINDKICIVYGKAEDSTDPDSFFKSDSANGVICKSYNDPATTEEIGFSSTIQICAIRLTKNVAGNAYEKSGSCIVELNGSTGAWKRTFKEIKNAGSRPTKWISYPTMVSLEV